MADFTRREFLRTLGLTSAGVAVAGSVFSLASCSSEEKKESSSGDLAALKVSSDLYASDLPQRFAFSIFDTNMKVVSTGDIPVTLIAPSGGKQEFNYVPVREKGIKGRGIYSVMTVLHETGSWLMKTTFEGKKLELAFSVNTVAIAPGLDTAAPTVDTPTTANPLDATILCTRFDGDCGLHTPSVPQLLATQKPFVVLFATPARCQTAYCGPVLDLTMNVAKKYPDIPAVHIEIYKNEKTADLLDAVTGWHLESEPWLFGINERGFIDSRLDGAFDQSEIEDVFDRLS